MNKRFLVTILLSLSLTMTTAESLTVEKPIPRKPVITSPHLLQQQAKVEKIKQTKEGKEIFTLAEHYARLHGIDHKLIKSIILAESSFNHKATSSAGAMGLMQVKPYKSRLQGVGCSNLFNIDCNIHVGVRHLSGMLARYKGNEDLALASYLLGGGAVKDKVPKSAQYYVDRVKSYKILF